MSRIFQLVSPQVTAQLADLAAASSDNAAAANRAMARANASMIHADTGIANAATATTAAASAGTDATNALAMASAASSSAAATQQAMNGYAKTTDLAPYAKTSDLANFVTASTLTAALAALPKGIQAIATGAAQLSALLLSASTNVTVTLDRSMPADAYSWALILPPALFGNVTPSLVSSTKTAIVIKFTAKVAIAASPFTVLTWS